MARLEHLYSYTAVGVLNQRTLTVPMKGFTAMVQIEREVQQATGIMWFRLNCAYYKGREGASAPPGVTLCQPHTRTEFGGDELATIPQAAEPLKLFLEHTLSRDAMLRQQGIQTGLGGVGLPSSIVKFDEVSTNLSDQVAMETDLGDAVNVGHVGVAVVPVATIGDGGIHLGFNLTHDVVSFG